MHNHYLERSESCAHPLGKKLLRLIADKKTNLGLSADVTTSKELLHLAETLGPEICVLKTHIDVIEDFTPALTKRLRELADQHQFMLFEDRKFADIGNTVQLQYEKGMYRIADWADIVNAHSLPGPGIITGLAEIGQPKQRGLLLLAEMSSANNFLDNHYTTKTVNLAEQHDEFVMGFISQRKLSDNPRWVYFTPGVQFAGKNDAHGQQYISPEQAIKVNQSDVILVGRGIYRAADPLAEAKRYRAAGWN